MKKPLKTIILDVAFYTIAALIILLIIPFTFIGSKTGLYDTDESKWIIRKRFRRLVIG